MGRQSDVPVLLTPSAVKSDEVENLPLESRGQTHLPGEGGGDMGRSRLGAGFAAWAKRRDSHGNHGGHQNTTPLFMSPVTQSWTELEPS